VYCIDAHLVQVEVDVGTGRMEDFNVVGLPDNAVKESRQRVKSALRNCGFEFPCGQGVTINLAPADLRKEEMSRESAAGSVGIDGDGGGWYERSVCVVLESIDLGSRAVLRIGTLFCAWLGRDGGQRMAPETKHLEVTLETHVESVNLAEEMCLRVAEAAGFNEDECYRIGMSVREGVINAFHYGNQEKPDKKIHLGIDLTTDKMVIHVTDEGKGFLLSDVPDPLAEENLLSTSGRGIFLMRTFMDEFNVVPGRTGGAEIIMSKKLPFPGEPPSNGNNGASKSGSPHQEV
jgi:serine/threonine-protein kinase RsbW